MDPMDFQIADILDRKGRISNREIARSIGVSETTVRHRLDRIIETGELTISAMIDIEKHPDIYMVLVGIKLSRKPEECVLEFSKIPSVLFTLTITGRYDVIACVIINSRKMLSRVINDEIGSVNGVIDTETFVVVDNAGLKVCASKLYDLMQNGMSANGGDSPGKKRKII